MKKQIKKGFTIANKFGQQFKVRRVEFACIVLTNGTHVPTAKAEDDFEIIAEA